MTALINRFLLLSLLFAACSVQSQEAAPITALQMEVPSIVQFGYQPFAGQPVSEKVTLRIALTEPLLESATAYNALLRIRPTNLGSFNLTGEQLQLPVELEAINNPSFRRVNNDYQVPYSFDLSQPIEESLELAVRMPESVYADAGVYTLELEVDIIDQLTQNSLGEPKIMVIEAVVLPKLQTNIAGSKGRYEDGKTFSVIDFGTLESGETKRVFIQVRGNANAIIAVSSENAGRMVNKESPSSSIDYSVDIDGEVSSLKAPLTLERSVAKNLQGSAYPMTVTIGDVSGRFSGVYQDIIQVDVSPQ